MGANKSFINKLQVGQRALCSNLNPNDDVDCDRNRDNVVVLLLLHNFLFFSGRPRRDGLAWPGSRRL